MPDSRGRLYSHDRFATRTVSASVFRPNDTNAYASGDVISNDTNASLANPIIFSGAARFNGLGGWIIGAKMINSANQPTKPQVNLWLFDARPSGQADNSFLQLTDTEAESFIGMVQFRDGFVGNSGVGAPGNFVAHGTLSNPASNVLAYQCKEDSTNIYGIPQNASAYPPTASGKFTFKLDILED